MKNPIRKAEHIDISRIAEILIFTKRTAYRNIFHDDQVSFGEMQVLPLAQTFLENPQLLENYWVYKEGYAKGLIRIEGKEICELYVDPFFQGSGVGDSLIRYAIEGGACRLWVLEKNEHAIRFYRKHGFEMTGERKLQEGTPEYIVRMEL